jgi:hypothetical protein
VTIKLGELLLNEKLITPEQLNEALTSQVIFGIKLGSSLVELGFITDEQLCALLSRKLGVPPVSPRALSYVSPDVLALVPAELAKKYRLIPIKVEGKKLALAMTDPTDFKAIDEVAFVSGCVVRPHIAPDVRITAALSKFYQVWEDTRYLRIEGEVANRRKKSTMKAVNQRADTIEIQMKSDTGELLNVKIPLEFEGFANLPGYQDYDFTALEGIGRYTVDRLSLDFASAKNRDQVADVFIKYLGQEFKIGALFVIHKNMAVGWRGILSGNLIEGLDKLSVPLNKPSVFKDVFDTQHFAMGALIQTPENAQILKSLGVSADTPLLVLPIIMVKKVVVALIVSADMEALGKRLLELQKLVYKASLAFETLIIKNKILMT